jgi:hypothetical protein
MLPERVHGIVNQTWRRLLEGDEAASSDDIVSVVHPHTAIIVTEDGRDRINAPGDSWRQVGRR